MFVIFQNGPSYDLRKVHPRLSSLRQPYRKVETCFWTDGGSIGIKILDRDGHEEQFAIRAKLGDPTPYTRVFVGALNDTFPAAVEVSDPEHTRWMLIRILSDRTDRTPWDDGDIKNLRGYPKDYIRFWYHRLCGHLIRSDI